MKRCNGENAPAGVDSYRGQGAILIFGLPRSGTTWLAKIFDSHPDTLYRHEPDIVQRENLLPYICNLTEVAAHVDLTRRYLNKLAQVRTLKSAGPPPFYSKTYRSDAARLLRTGILQGLRTAGVVALRSYWTNCVPIGDFITKQTPTSPRIVIKSVGAAGRARLFAEAWCCAKVIVIVRHPCGQVASVARGTALGKFFDVGLATDLASAPLAVRLGLSVERIDQLEIIEQLAWAWTLANQSMLDDLRGMTHVRVVLLRDLASNAKEVARDLFDFSELPWNSQTEHFIESSASPRFNNQFYGLKRNPRYVVDGWRGQLSDRDQERILTIASRTEIGRRFA